MTICDLICIGEWIFLIFWFISVPIYCMVIYVIWKHRKTKFKKEFWSLTIALFVADMLHLCQLWAHKLAAWGFLPSVVMRAPNVVGWLMLVPKVAFFHAQVMGVIFLSINRYVAIAKPMTVLWTRKVTILCICAQWGTAAFMFLSLGSFRFTLKPISNVNESGFLAVIDQRDKAKAGIFLGLVLGCGGLLRVLFFMALYGHMFYYIRKEKAKAKQTVLPVVAQMVAQFGHFLAQKRAPVQSWSNRAQVNLVVIGSVLALCDMAITIHIFNIAVNVHKIGIQIGPEQIRFWSFRGVCFYDIYGWSNGWLLLAFSTVVRREFLKQYTCVKSNEVDR